MSFNPLTRIIRESRRTVQIWWTGLTFRSHRGQIVVAKGFEGW